MNSLFPYPATKGTANATRGSQDVVDENVITKEFFGDWPQASQGCGISEYRHRFPFQ